MYAVYIRVSTTGQNIESQKSEISRWLSGDNKTGQTVRWYIDRATGNNLDRPEFTRLQADIFNGEIETIVVWRLDRLSRNLKDGVNVLCDWCNRGLRVVATSQLIDLSGTLGKMLAAVLLGVAEMEQEARRERQHAGIQAAKSRGVYIGRKKGTTKAKPQRAIELRNRGLSAPEIGKALAVSESTVYRYLKS